MRTFGLALLLVMLFPLTAWCDQVVERQGWKVLTFDVPGMELRGSKDGRTTRSTYAKKVGEGPGEVKINVTIKSWMAIDTYESKFREDKTLKRASGETRLREDIDIPGATKVLSYTGTAPYDSEVVVLYTKDFRCELVITTSSDKEAKAELEPTFQRLIGTLVMRGLDPISPIRVESKFDKKDESKD